MSTSPGDGQVVAAAPSVVSVRFDEPVQMQFGALRVFSPSGGRVDEGSPTHPAGHEDTVQVALGSGLGRGTYTVAWHVISADSHPVSGAFTFSVGASSATSVSQDTLNAAGSTVVGLLYGLARVWPTAASRWRSVRPVSCSAAGHRGPARAGSGP